MNKSYPKVSIGLPVYNGERYLSEAIESLLNQTFGDFEIIICDNASTDGTEAICRSYASRDQRIRYYRNRRNVGAAANFNWTFELASGEYFKWAAHDDVLAPDFLLRCVEVLDKDTSLVLCHSQVQFIDEHGKFIKNRGVLLPNTDSPKVHVRFADLTRMDHWAFEIFGLIRTNALKQTPLIASYVGSDKNTLVALGLLGRIYRIPERLFFSRHHAERSVEEFDPSFRAEWFDPKKRGRISFLYWRLFLEFIKSVSRADLSVRERTACYLHLVKWPRLNLRLLKKDARVGVKHIANRFFKIRKTGKVIS